MEELMEKMTSQSSPDSDPVVVAAPPPPPVATHTVDEAFAELNKLPLFMTELEENDDIAALQALSYEGTPLENGTDFKDRGNEVFRSRRWKDACEFYTKGVDILWMEERKRARRERGESDEEKKSGEKGGQEEDNVAEDSPEEIQQQRDVLAQLYSNRAACHLTLKNYRSCWLDCGAALRLNPSNIKALHRSSRALLAVDRTDEAIDACDHGLALDPSNKSLIDTRAEAVKRGEFLARKAAEEREREAREKKKSRLVREALAKRKIRTRTTPKPPDMEDATIALVPGPDDDNDEEQGTLAFPTLLLYPVNYESDFVKAFGEHDTLDEHLAYILPLPWDAKGEYTAAGTECYVETAGDAARGKPPGLMKVGKKVALGKVLGTGRVEVVDELVRVFVLPRDKAEAWVGKHKEELAKRAGV